MKLPIWVIMSAVLVGCNMPSKELGYTPEPGSERLQRTEYRKGRDAAKTDLRVGILGYESIDGGEEEAWQILWCYRKILKSHYGITYRCQGFLPGPIAYAAGYQSVVRPIIEGRLGGDWEKRVYLEAKTFHREHWSEVADDYRREQWNGR